jgi:hypothetical protein
MSGSSSLQDPPGFWHASFTISVASCKDFVSAEAALALFETLKSRANAIEPDLGLLDDKCRSRTNDSLKLLLYSPSAFHATMENTVRSSSFENSRSYSLFNRPDGKSS